MMEGRERRNLYERRSSVPDNYTFDKTFLAGIEFNKNLRLYSLQECLQGAAILVRELSLVITFWSLYEYLREGLITSSQLVLALCIVITTGYLHYSRKFPVCDIISGIKTTVLFLVIGYGVSPILYRLTDTISTDTIHSMAAFGLAIHTLTQHYGISGPIVSRTVALNSAVFSTVCLASRLSSHMAAFSLLCLAVFCFLLVPMWSEVYQPKPQKSLLSGFVSVLLLANVMPGYSILAAAFLFLVQIFCPLVFFSLQSYKKTIHGPWDEAVLN